MNISKKKKTLHITMSPELLDSLKEIASSKGISYSEELRNMVAEGYRSFIRFKYGYQAGKDTSERRVKKDDKKNSIEGKIKDIDILEDEALSNLLTESGFYEFLMHDAQGDEKFILRTDDVGRRFVSLRYADGNFSDRYDMVELKSALKRFLQSK